MGMAEKRLPVRKFTLNVYTSNTTAISLYRSLGFAEQAQQDLDGVLCMSMPAKNSANADPFSRCYAKVGRLRVTLAGKEN
jgi:hypothetical protein